MPKKCRVADCTHRVFSGGYCIRHYGLSPAGKRIIASQRAQRLYKPRSHPGMSSVTRKTNRVLTALKTPKKAIRKRSIHQADLFFSRYIRLKYSQNGVVQCVTCGKLLPIKKIQCGHYMSRRHLNTRWNEQNAGPQCVGCNKWRNGEPQMLGHWLDRTFGPGTSERMRVKALVSAHFETSLINLNAEVFKNQYQAIARTKGDPWKPQR